jgi:hypothetical protein
MWVTVHRHWVFKAETLAAAAIFLVLVVYDRESTGSRLLFLPLRWPEDVGTSNSSSVLLKDR